ncbi:MAG: peptide deformylase [Patescibacteria group bacterium]
MKPILQKEAPVLRQHAKPVPLKDIGGARLNAILKDMREALAKEADGVGLAAPQIGVPLRMFVISELVFSSLREKGGTDEKGDTGAARQLVYINPEIIATSKDKKQMEEGCLSVRPLFGKVRRASKATIRAYDEHGNAFERGASGLLAQIFQHEVDHLDGILFIDKAKDIREMPVPEQIQTHEH